MRRQLAQLMFPVLRAGADLRRRRRQGDPVRLVQEWTRFKVLLEPAEAVTPAWTGIETIPAAGGPFLGVRYALTCWLDEMLTQQGAWPKQGLERRLVGTDLGPWKFWEQALRAEQHKQNEALEGYFLCVALGFRGVLGDTPTRLEEWFGKVRTRLGQAAPWWQPPPAFVLPEAAAAPRVAIWPRRLAWSIAAPLVVGIPAALAWWYRRGF